ncbi:MAG TPA: T9SS type A sorting domain-containing protein [Ignavibacteria bacterium]|nr:T9SS type A sorting domain-containing protein [Ignavibacteria bacterium]
MKKISLLILFFSINVNSQSLAPAQSIFMQGNNINAVFRTDGYFNYDKVTFSSGQAGFIWPATSPQRLTAVFTSGIWIGAKVGPERELRLAASFYNTHYTPGNIPVIGQVPPSSVCSDPSWRGYYVQLTDPSLFAGGTRYKMAGGRQYTFNYDSWAAWPVQKGAPYVEVNGIPGYQPAWNGDRPGIGNGMTARPEEILFMVFMDYTNCTDNIHSSELSLPGGTLPLGVEVQQIVFNFNCIPLRDMYFTKFRVINKSSLNWDSVYFSSANDPDIGNFSDEPAGCDSTRDLGFQYKMNNTDPNYGPNPPSFGTRFVQSPLVFTGSNSDTAKLPYDTLVGYKQIGMTSYNKFLNAGNECTGDPENAVRAYSFMQGLDGCGNQLINWVTGAPSKYRFNGDACRRVGWYDSVQGQRRYVQNSGPFKSNSGDTQIVVLSYMITRDGGNNFQNVCALQSLSDSALKYYYNDFRTCVPIGIEPISTDIPQKFELSQNYPNPFNPATKIRFSIPAFAESTRRVVSLRIYDVLGKEIAVPVNQNLKPGIYEIDWNAENIPSGVYFYSLITYEFTQTKKMVVLK